MNKKIIIALIGVIVAISILIVGFLLILPSSDIYKTKIVCETMTGVTCSYFFCEKDCPKGPMKGWVPVQMGLCDYDNSGKDYIEKHIRICSLIDFVCPEGSKTFSNDCGCGCEKINEDIAEEEIKQEIEINKDFVAPIDMPSKRASLKKFGDYITPQNSPVQPERFSGYHTGVDFEVFENELDLEVEISSICTGTLKEKRRASGYGGLVVVECELENEPITVIYGHLDLESITFKVGDKIMIDAVIGDLGDHKTTETDNERKHLHLGIHKGESINIKGYVRSEQKLKDWIDPCEFVCN